MAYSSMPATDKQAQLFHVLYSMVTNLITFLSCCESPKCTTESYRLPKVTYKLRLTCLSFGCHLVVIHHHSVHSGLLTIKY